MDQDKQKLKRKNLLVGWSIGILAVALYVAAFYFNVAS
jgi:hypothetical protein